MVKILLHTIIADLCIDTFFKNVSKNMNPKPPIKVKEGFITMECGCFYYEQVDTGVEYFYSEEEKLWFKIDDLSDRFEDEGLYQYALYCDSQGLFEPDYHMDDMEIDELELEIDNILDREERYENSGSFI